MSDDRAGPQLVVGDRALAFAEKIIELLDRTRTTATYKFAVLLGLMDACQARFSKDGHAPTSITTFQLAEAVVGLYWNQVRPFHDARLRQIRNLTGDSIPARIHRARAQHDEAALARVRTRAPAAYRALIEDVEVVLVAMPLPKLQKVGGREVRFIYQLAWDDGHAPTERAVRARDFDNQIRFVDGAADHLVRLSGFLRPVIQRRWTLWVSALNRKDSAPAAHDSELEHHLFGSARENLRSLHGPLRELQGGRCFYCGGAVRTAQIDHFIPWARVPLEAIENYVLADASCNGNKCDSLAASAHVAAWSARLRAHGADLARIAADVGWESAPDRAVGLARSIYLPLTSEALLWTAIDTFVAPDKAALFTALA
jgi:hypothetical protein